MASLFGGGSTAKPTPPATSLRIQQSIQGAPIPIGWGRNRMAGILIWYGDFHSMAQQQQGGKGAGSSGGKFGSGQNSSVNYQAAVAIAIAEGGANGLSIEKLYANSAVGLMSDYNLTLIPGTRDQLPWGYLTTFHPDQALPYHGLGYMAAGPMQLGSSPVLPNISIEVTFSLNTAIAGVPDANPADIVTDFLTNDDYGLTGFGAGLLADLGEFETFCQAAGIFLSPILTAQSSASAFLQDVLYATNSEAFFSGGQLYIVPYWDQPISGNGATFTPALAPVYNFQEDDFIAQGGGDPIKISRKPTSKTFNCLSLQIADRTNYYNPTVLEVKNEASIQQFGLKKQSTKQLPMICLASSGMMAAQMQLSRQDIMNDYTFTVPGKYIKVNPMDVVTLTSAKSSRGLTLYPVRVKEITENKGDGTLTMFAEDVRAGTNSIVRASHPSPTGAAPDYNIAPGSVAPPVIFEPPHGLAGDLEVWGAVYGPGPNWGGCEIWVSSDGLSYEYAGRQLGPARVGTLSAALAPPVVIPPQPDVVNTLSVDISASGATLSTASEVAAQALGTVCWIEGEVLAYANATPTGAGLYNLTYLIRGAYGTQAALVTHPTGSRFVRLDEGVFRIPYTRASVGITLFVKFLSFNRYGSARQTLADATAYMFTNNGTSISLQSETLAERIDRLDKAVTEQIQPALDLFSFVTADLDASGLLQRYAISGDIRSQVSDAETAANDQIAAVVSDQNARRATLASAIQVQLDSATAAIATNATTIASVNGALSTLSSSVTSQFATTNATVSTLSTSFSNSQTALASYQSTVAAHFATNDSAISTNATAISTANSSIASLSTTVSANYTSLSGSIATNTASINTNATAIANTNSTVASLSSTVSANYTTLSGGIATNSAGIATNSANIATNATAISNANSSIASLSSTVSANYGTLSGQISTNSANISTNATAIATANTNIANLTSTVTSNYNSLSSSVASNATAISNTNSTLSSLSSTVTANYNTLSAGVSTNASAIATTNGQVASLFTLTLNANNYVAGFTSVNTGTFSAITFQFDAFRIASSTVGGRSVFDLVTVNGVTTLGLRGDALFDGVVQARMMSVDSITAGNGAIQNLSVQSLKLGDNAVTVPKVQTIGTIGVVAVGVPQVIASFNVPINVAGLDGKNITVYANCVFEQSVGGGASAFATAATLVINGAIVFAYSYADGTQPPIFVLAGSLDITVGAGVTSLSIPVSVQWQPGANSGTSTQVLGGILYAMAVKR